jgi:hypothetical protein
MPAGLPAARRPVAASDRCAEVRLDAVGLLEAVGEKELDEGSLSGHEVARLVAAEDDYGEVGIVLDPPDERAELVDGIRVSKLTGPLSKVTGQ